MRPPRLALLAGALLVPALPLLSAAPAQAAVGTICVGAVPAGTACNQIKSSIQDAINTVGIGSGDTIRVGNGSFTDGPYVLPAGVNLRGSGAGTNPANATVLSLGAGAQTYLTVAGGTIADLRVDTSTGNGATGIAASASAIIDNVVVFGPGSTNAVGIQAQGSQVNDATVNVTGGSGNTAIRSLGGNLLYSDSTWNGGATGYRLTGGGTDTISRITIQSAGTAIAVENGTLNIDDSVLDLGATGTTGLLADSTDAAVVSANHLTVVGGAAGSRGVVSDAAGAGTLSSVVTLTNSIVRGPTTSLVQVPGAPGSNATFTASRTDYQTTTGTVGDGGGNLIGVDPLFLNPTAGDYHLRAGSPVVDKAAGSSASRDRDNLNRSFDGDRDGTAQPDMGAYELRDVTAPKTTFTSGPNGPTNNRQPVFQFTSEAGATFECSLDGGGVQPCASPITTPPLSEGSHSISVRATDAAGNVETPFVTRTFTVDTVVPNAKITKKPAKRFFKQRVKFKFAASEPGAKFQCSLDGRAWKSCKPTFSFNTKVGRHQLRVRAVDAAGNIDPTPAKYRYKRLKRHR